MGCLYKLTSPSGKSYVGITSKTLEARWAKHVEHALGKRENGALYAALRKYGTHAFTREVLAEATDWGVLCVLERETIARLNTFSPNGYNLTVGGEGILGPRSEEARLRISIAQKKRFQRPDERARLAAVAVKAQEVRRQKRALLPKKQKPLKVRLTREEHAARTRAGMAKPEVHAKVIACAQKRAADPAWRKRVSAGKRGRIIGPHTPEWNQKIADARRREWADPAMRHKRTEAMRQSRQEKA